MAAKKLYGSYEVDPRKTMTRMKLLGVSHSVKRLRRLFGTHPIFEVREKNRYSTRDRYDPGLLTTHVEYDHFGREIAA